MIPPLSGQGRPPAAGRNSRARTSPTAPAGAPRRRQPHRGEQDVRLARRLVVVHLRAFLAHGVHRDVLNSLVGSVRIADDMIQYEYADTPCNLLLRDYHAISKHEEWRCFIRNGQIVGITQYFYAMRFAELVSAKDWIAKPISPSVAPGRAAEIPRIIAS